MDKFISSQIIFDQFFKIREDKIIGNDGKIYNHTSLQLRTDAAVVLGQDTEGRYILNYEYRHTARRFLLGCAGGLIETNEDPFVAGQREFLEETGYFAEEIVLTGIAYPFPGICDQKIHYFWAKNAIQKNKPKLDPLEIIEIKLMTELELKQSIRGNSNIDAILCSALWFKENHEKKSDEREDLS